jgi:type IV pilus assembly protein PilB
VSSPLPERVRLGDVLVAAGVLTPEELEEALATQRSIIGSRRRLGHVLVDLGVATERQIADALAGQLGLEVADLTKYAIAPDVVRMLPRGVAQRLGVVVLARSSRQMTVAVTDPTDVVALDDLRLHTGATDLTLLVATETQVREHLTRVWSLAEDSAEVTTYFDDIDVAPPDQDDGAAADDAPTVRLVSMVLADAVRAGASDIHLEPQRETLRVRYRVDGVLRDVMSVPRSAMASVVSRLKIVSGLDIAERRLPQDGRTRISVDGQHVDARVATIPSIHGEKVVVRLLARADQVPPLDGLGLEPDQLAVLRHALTSPQGLVLITGPTGAGKTSTLYSALADVHSPERNIVALEDPVEVQMAGITQIQGLRAVLRQDPDVILLGEIRDSETAGLAVRASLTGHLVLTTLHTNSAVSAMTRLVDMGVEPFMVASSLTAVVAQRLVRRPCQGCLVPDDPDPALLESLGVDAGLLAGATPRRGEGCTECGQSGYRGRTGIYEVLLVDQHLRRVLGRDPTERAIVGAATGLRTLRDAALARALAGETTFEEVARVSPRD